MYLTPQAKTALIFSSMDSDDLETTRMAVQVVHELTQAAEQANAQAARARFSARVALVTSGIGWIFCFGLLFLSGF